MSRAISPSAPRRQRTAVRGLGALAIVLLALGLSTCRSTKDAVLPPMPQVTPDLLYEIHQSLGFLPAQESETFRDFLPRARAAMLLADSADVQATARRIPQEPVLMVGGPSQKFFPVLVAEWARRRSRARRVQTLQALLRIRTDGLHKDPARLGAPRRKDGRPYPPDPRRFIASLQSRVLSMDLRFKSHDGKLLEIGQKTRGRIIPKMKLGTVLLARGNTRPLETDAAWKHPPFAGELDDQRVFGRGAVLAKGAMVAALFALDAVIDSGVPIAHPPHVLIELAADDDAPGLPPFEKERGLPPRLFAIDSALPMVTSATGVIVADVVSAPDRIGPGQEDRYRLVAIDAPAASGALPGRVDFVWTRPATKSALSAAEEMKKLRAAVGDRNQDMHLAFDGRAFLGSLETNPGAAYAPHIEDGAVRRSIEAMESLGAAGLLASSPCQEMLGKLGALVSAPETLGVGNVLSSAEPEGVSIGLGRVTTDDDGRCRVGLEIRWTQAHSPEEVVASLCKTLGTEITVNVSSSAAPYASSPAPASRKIAVEAWQTLNGSAPTARVGRRETMLRFSAAAMGIGPLPFESDTPRADVPDEYLSIDELDDLVALYVYILAGA